MYRKEQMYEFFKRYKVVFCFVASLFLLSGCTATETFDDGDFEYGYSIGKMQVFVFDYIWDGDTSKMRESDSDDNPSNIYDVYIPDEYEGKKITNIGGYIGRGLPAPFFVRFPEKYDIPNEDDRAFSTDEEELVTDKEYDTYTFVIHIGPNVKEFYGSKDTYFGREDEDTKTQDIYYKIHYEYEIDTANKYLSLKDGKVCEND